MVSSFWHDPQQAFLANLITAIPCFLLCAWAQFRGYPFFLKIDPGVFSLAHRLHCRRLGWVAPLPFLADLLAAIWLIYLVKIYLSAFNAYDGAFRPQFYLAGMHASLTAVGWASTFLLIVPLHRRLENGFDEGTVRTLIRLNAVRTVAWALKILVSLLFWRA